MAARAREKLLERQEKLEVRYYGFKISVRLLWYLKSIKWLLLC